MSTKAVQVQAASDAPCYVINQEDTAQNQQTAPTF